MAELLKLSFNRVSLSWTSRDTFSLIAHSNPILIFFVDIIHYLHDMALSFLPFDQLVNMDHCICSNGCQSRVSFKKIGLFDSA